MVAVKLLVVYCVLGECWGKADVSLDTSVPRSVVFRVRCRDTYHMLIIVVADCRMRVVKY